MTSISALALTLPNISTATVINNPTEEPGNIDVPNPATGRQGLENFLETMFIDNQNVDIDILIETPHGPVEVRVARVKTDQYPGQNYLILSTSQTAADSSRLYITLNKRNQPISLQPRSNSKDLFAGLLNHAGCPYLANLLGIPDVSTFADQIATLRTYEQAFDLTREIRLGSTQGIHPSVYAGERGTYVDQSCYTTTALDIPLSTHHLVTCSALVVIDRNNNQHYLAHVDDFTTKADIEQSLAELDLQNSDIYIMRGARAFGTLQNILVVLLEAGLGERVTIVAGNGYNDGITSHQGEVYLGITE